MPQPKSPSSPSGHQSMTQAVSPKALFTQIDHDSQVADQLIELLGREQEALKQRNSQQLESLITEKNALLAALANSANQRRTWLTSQGKPADEAHWEELIQAMGGQKLDDLWQALQEKLQQCHHLNEVNGKMIARGQQTINRLLDILRGQFDAPKLYNQSGNTQTHKSRGGVVKA